MKKISGASGVAACERMQNCTADASATPASSPVVAPNIRRPSSYVSSTDPSPSSTDGSRADHSLTPNARYENRWSQYVITGLAVRSSQLNVGTTQVPASSISRVHSAFTPSSMSQRLCAPRFGSVSSPQTATRTR